MGGDNRAWPRNAVWRGDGVLDDHWGRIPFLPERFEASRDGAIRTRSYVIELQRQGEETHTRRIAGRVLSQRFERRHARGDKHVLVSISLGGSREKPNKNPYRVGYLVAATFHGLPFDRHDRADVHRWKLRFIDGDVKNCSAENLEWVRNCMDTGDGRQHVYETNLTAWRDADVTSTIGRLFEGNAA